MAHIVLFPLLSATERNFITDTAMREIAWLRAENVDKHGAGNAYVGIMGFLG